MTACRNNVTPAFARPAVRLVILLLALAILPCGYAIGPDNYGYTAALIAFNFDDLSVNTVPAVPILDNTDDDVIEIPIGFPFTIYGVKYTTVWVSTNGLLTFGGGDGDYTPKNFTVAGPLQNLKTIAPLWNDWEFVYQYTDEAYYLTLGTPGSRRLVVQWNFAQPRNGNGIDTVTFEVKLFEGSNNIEFHYDDATVSDDRTQSNGRACTVGIRDVNGQTTGKVLQWSFDQAVINDSSAIRYTAPSFKVKTITRQAANGNIVLTCTGAPSKPNYIEVTTNLATGFSRLPGSITADVNGNFTYTDTSPGTRKFYRVGLP